ncbi:glycosyltransferase family 22 protein [Botryobasidium botryosum FD-172 SS1]|uniref:Mannosyltransferase n=1 Tax=Botryobasidium botryosum (strain FD-172 SS1) TaxID=930990 RepID=A0A067MQM1_BOTB1|nr:glycosyltransferase family 22 protein [Botryobasidium botryosum FD-172 SS1]
MGFANRNAFYVSLAVRVAIALATRTFFQPDEYFQSLEPAHRAVFGYGMLTWEWISARPIRSIAYPTLWMPVYWTLKVTGLDQGAWLIVAPKMLQAVFAAATDYWTYLLARKVLGPKYAPAALFLSLISFFNVLALSRTLSNSLETCLTVGSLYYWPLSSDGNFSSRQSFRISLFSAVLGCIVRPTNVILWAFMWLDLVRRRSTAKFAGVVPVLLDTFIAGLLAASALLSIDTIYNGRLTFTPLNFVLTNLSAVSLFYGRNPWHYYIFQALPILCTTALPFTLHGSWLTLQGKANPAAAKLLSLAVWTTTVYSCAGHKEWRFIHPLLPIFHLLAAKSLVDLHHVRTPPSKSRDRNRATGLGGFLSIGVREFAIISLSVPASIYVMLFHGRAQIAVMHHLRTMPATELHSIGFLMPCHSTPWQAYLHRPEMEGRMWALGCEPPLNGQDLATYEDQTKVFYSAPITYLTDRFPETIDSTFPTLAPPSDIEVAGDWTHSWPSHFVMFGALLGQTENGVSVMELLKDRGYVQDWKVGNGWEEDEKRRGGVQIWKWASQSQH